MKTRDRRPRTKKEVLILFGRVTMEYVVLGKSGSMRSVLDNERLPVGGNRVLQFDFVGIAVDFKEVAFLRGARFPLAHPDENPYAGAQRIIAFASTGELAANDAIANHPINALDLAHTSAEYFDHDGIHLALFFRDAKFVIRARRRHIFSGELFIVRTTGNVFDHCIKCKVACKLACKVACKLFCETVVFSL